MLLVTWLLWKERNESFQITIVVTPSLTVLTHAIVEEAEFWISAGFSALWALSNLVTKPFSMGFSLDPRSIQ